MRHENKIAAALAVEKAEADVASAKRTLERRRSDLAEAILAALIDRRPASASVQSRGTTSPKVVYSSEASPLRAAKSCEMSSARSPMPDHPYPEEARAAVVKAIHSHACGCKQPGGEPWPLHPDYEAMSDAVIEAFCDSIGLTVERMDQAPERDGDAWVPATRLVTPWKPEREENP